MTEEVAQQENVLQEPTKPPFKVFVAVLAHDTKVHVPCVQGLINAGQLFQVSGIPFEIHFEAGSGGCSMLRNKLVRVFLESDCTDMVFIDSDVGFTPEAFRDLISSTENVIAGVYPKKEEKEVYPLRLKFYLDEKGIERPIVENGICEAEGLPAGFLKIRREVFEKMIAAYPELEYDEPFANKKNYSFFGEFIKDQVLYLDDFAFCYRWRAIGGRCWALPNITFIHCGQKHFVGNLHDFMLQPQEGGPKWTSDKPAKK